MEKTLIIIFITFYQEVVPVKGILIFSVVFLYGVFQNIINPY